MCSAVQLYRSVGRGGPTGGQGILAQRDPQSARSVRYGAFLVELLTTEDKTKPLISNC
jgi:hypothetical protein